MAHKLSTLSLVEPFTNDDSTIDQKILAAYHLLRDKKPNHYLLRRLNKVSPQGFELNCLFKKDYEHYRLDKVNNSGWLNHGALNHYLNDLNKAINLESQSI